MRLEGTRLRTGVLAVILALFAAVVATPAHATTHSKAMVVLFVHGTAIQGSNGDCSSNGDQGCYQTNGCAADGDGYIHSLVDGVKARGFTGKLLTVGYYRQYAQCDIRLADGYNPVGITATCFKTKCTDPPPLQPLTFKERGAYLNQYIYQHYTSQNIPVDLVGHSQGGLVIRAAVLWSTLSAPTGTQQTFANSPGTNPASVTVTTYRIDVSDAVTIDAPHNGLVSNYGTDSCSDPQCAAMKSGSAELNWLHQDGNPQAWHGTEWTNINGSQDGDVGCSLPFCLDPQDHVVTMASGTSMSIPASNKNTTCAYNHNQMTNNACAWGALANALGFNDALVSHPFPSWILYNNALLPGQSLVSANGNYRLTMEQAGNLDEHDAGGTKIWDTGILNGCSGPAYAAMQDDGNFVIYRMSTSACADAGKPIWSTHTYQALRPSGPYGTTAGLSFLALQDDGNFAVFNSPYGTAGNYGTPTWYAFSGNPGGNSPIQAIWLNYMCLDVAGGNTAPGALVQIWQCANTYNQQWTISWLDGTIRSMGNCLVGTAAGNQLQMLPCGQATAGQKTWTVANGQFINAGTGLCADVQNYGTSNGTPVLAWTCKSSTENPQNQIFGTHYIRGYRGAWFPKCFTTQSVSFAPGTPIVLWDCYGGVNQEFFGNGYGLVTFGNECLTANGFGNQLTITPCNGGANQQWTGYWDGVAETLRPQADLSLCADAFGPSSANGTVIGLWTCNDQENQSWTTP